MRAHALARTHTHTPSHTRTLWLTHTHARACARTRTHARTHAAYKHARAAHARTHTHTHTHPHTHTHTHTQPCSPESLTDRLDRALSTIHNHEELFVAGHEPTIDSCRMQWRLKSNRTQPQFHGSRDMASHGWPHFTSPASKNPKHPCHSLTEGWETAHAREVLTL